MAYAYVYAPISGTATERDSYCSCPCGNCGGCGSAHGRCKDWASPIDIAGTGSTCPTTDRFVYMLIIRPFIAYEHGIYPDILLTYYDLHRSLMYKIAQSPVQFQWKKGVVMPYAYIYSPISGVITGYLNYCICPCNFCTGCGSEHVKCCVRAPECNWTSPVDIAGMGPDIYLFVNSYVQSVRTYLRYFCCDGQNNDYSRVVIVELFSEPNANGYIGRVKYGHVGNPTVEDNRIYNLWPYYTLKLGTILMSQYGRCYTGPHIHLEVNSNNNAQSLVCCCTNVSAKTTAIYKIYF